MSMKEVTVCIDERWYDALNEHLRGETVEGRLDEMLNAMIINALPGDVIDRISKEIEQEEQSSSDESQPFAVFHVIERKDYGSFLIDDNADFLTVATTLSNYLSSESGSTPELFRKYCKGGQEIDWEKYDGLVAKCGRQGEVESRAYEIDLNKRAIWVTDDAGEWKQYSLDAVREAATLANAQSSASYSHQVYLFENALAGKEIPYQYNPTELSGCGSRRLRSEDIVFRDGVSQGLDQLSFDMSSDFPVDEVLGTSVSDERGDRCVMVGVGYDLQAGAVKDSLIIMVVHCDGSEEDCKYKLSDEEKDMLTEKMDAFCREDLGKSLSECREQYLTKQSQAPGMAPTM